MAGSDEFAHGSYGDYSGVNFYGPADERLSVSDRFMVPLFQASLERAWAEGRTPPRIAVEWNTLDGWVDVGAGKVEVAAADARELAGALAGLGAGDLAPFAGGTVDECLRCASEVRGFIEALLAQGRAVFIEED